MKEWRESETRPETTNVQPSNVQPSQWPPWVAFGGAGAVAVGSLLPWVTVHSAFGSISVAGTEGDGVITLIIGLAFAAAYAAKKIPLAAPAGFAALVMAIYELTNVQSGIRDAERELGEFATASVGIGLWIVLIGAIAMLAGVQGHRSAQRGGRSA
jgi:hypothetical protein